MRYLMNRLNLAHALAVIFVSFSALASEISDLTDACDKGQADKCNQAGFYYAEPHGKAKAKLTKSKDYFEKACVLQASEGCYNLGVIFSEGKGVKQDFSSAVDAFTEACELKSGPGCTAMGAFYESEKSQPPAPDKAAGFYDKGCQLNDATGCYHYALLAASGTGIPKNEPASIIAFDKSCSLGNGEACASLASIYQNGFASVTKDENKAKEYQTKACAAGYSASCNTQEAKNPPKPTK